MKRNKMNLDPKLSLAKKISIKALDFGKLPKKLMSSNFKTNTFLNITRSSSNIIDNLPSSLGKQNKKTYFMKPMTSRSRNDNAIKLNEIPKTSYMNVTPIQKMKQLSRNKNLNNNLFTQSIYHSYNHNNNNHQSAKCITFNTNNIPNNNQPFCQFNIFNKMTSKGTSRNMSNPNILVNNSTYNSKIKNKNNINATSSGNIIQKFVNSNINFNNSNSNYGSHEHANGNKNIDSKNFIINGYKHNPNGKNFRGTISNFGSLSYKKYGIKVKKKKLLNKMEEQNSSSNDVNKYLKNLNYFKNYDKSKIFVLWRIFTSENSKAYKCQKLNDFLNTKMINFYYKNKLIRKYNQIKKEEKTWKKLVIPQKNLEINEQNKGSILISLYDYANTTIQSVFFNNRIKNFNHHILYSISLYIFELMVKQINLVLYNIKYVFRYYYDEKKRAIIKRPSVSEIKDLLLNINSIIEKPNITNKSFQDFIINLSKYIANLNLNKNQTKPIVSQYLELYRGNNKINGSDIKKSLQFGNIFNDFSPLQIKDSNYILNEIMNLLNECKNNLLKYYLLQDFNDNDNFFILLYKIQPIRTKILKIEEKIKNFGDKNDSKNNNNNNGKDNNIFEEIIKKKDKLKLFFNDVLNEIESKYQENLVNSNAQNIKIILPFLMFQLLKNNIVYNNLFEGISLLENNKNYLALPKNKDIYNTYNKLYNNGYIDFDYIIYLCLFDKYSKFIETPLSQDICENSKLLYKILIYIEEMNFIYNKINVFEDNKLTQTIKNIHNEIIKNDEKLEKLKKIYLDSNNNKNNNTKKLNNKNNFEDVYKDLISHYIKYDIYKKDNTNNIKNISYLEKILFKQIMNQNNTNNNNSNNLIGINNNKLIMKKEQKEILQKINTYNSQGDINILRELSPLNKSSKKFFLTDKIKIKGMTYSYPRILLLSSKEISTISSSEKISLIDISKYYSIIHQGQELELKGITINKNIILGIQIYNNNNINNKKDSEFFKFNNPVNIISQNKSSKNTLNYLSNLYSNIKSEIENSLTKQLIESLSLFSKKDFHDWVNATFGQITICTLSLIFTHEISKLLVQDNNADNNNKGYLKDYKLINEKYNNFLQDECAFINKIRDRINVTLTIISQMNIIEALIKDDVHDINSFNWLKYIRHLWDKNKKEVIIECGGWANYQMKKLNKYRYRLLLSPDTDKIFLFNSSCFREKSASIIKVINNKYNNNSYKEIFEEYCSLFWTDMIDINLAITPIEDMKQIFDVCTTDCSWIYIDNLDLFKYNNDNNTINNLIYFSKFIQTIQQEVILNDIKLNEGEKMFCLMSCLNVEDNIKLKSECLKGSCRILNFIKPDIEFYLNISFKLYKYSNQNQSQNLDNFDKINKNLTEILLKNEQVIRDKLNGFYFDFDYFNEFLIYYLKAKPGNMININNKLDNIFISFLDLYCNKFMGTIDKNGLDEHLILKYFENKKIIIDNERIQLFKYLFYLTKNKVKKQNIILQGYSRHYIIESFKNFYFQQTNQVLDIKNDIINGNINLIYFEKTDNLNNVDVNFENKKIFNLSAPKNKVLINIFLEEIIYKLKRVNYLVNEKYKNMIIEYIYRVIKNNSNNTIFYRSLCNFNNWINKYIDYMESNKIKINDIIFYNIINDCLLITLGHEKNRLKSIMESSRDIFDIKLYKPFIENINKFKNSNIFYFYFDIEELTFKNFSNCIDYIKSYHQYISHIINNSKIIFIISDYFANKNPKEINSLIYKNNIELFITNEITKVYDDNEFSNHSNILKIFIGYEQSYNNQNINTNFVNNNEKLEKILKKIDTNLVKKYLDFLNYINIKNYSFDELIFVYKAIDINYKEKIEIKNIKTPLNIIKDIYKVAPKAIYYININNNLLKFLFKNKILIDVTSIIFNKEIKDINYKSNNIYLDINNELCIKIISEILQDLILDSLRNKNLINILNLSNLNNDIENYMEEDEINLISNMVNDIYNIPSETSFFEKYQNTSTNFTIFKKFFNILEIPITNITNDNYLNSRIIIQFIKYGNINIESLNYKCLSKLSDLFNNNSSKIHDISILINETLNNYKDLISNKNEYINSKYYFFTQMKISSQMKENIYNSILEKIYLSMSNHFLFSLLLTIEIMLNNFEISLYEKEFLLNYLKQNYIFLSNNTIKYKYETEQENIKLNYIKENGNKLIDFYNNKSKSIDDNYLSLLKKSFDNINNKYFYTSSLKKINRDVDKLLYYITFIPEQSSSMFKYIINKYLLTIINFSHFNINDALRKPTTKENLIPITVNAFPSINVINFLCSLSAYYEINFYIVRNGNIYNKILVDNSNYGYQYLIDGGLFELLKDGMKNGYWILICEKIDIIKFMKIMYELYINLGEININKNFKIFFDEKLIEDNCQKAIENNTMIININYENVDDLEAAHDIWVNVLEEKILTDSVMNQTQKDVLEIIEDSSDDKTNLIGHSINNTGENKNFNLNNTGNSIISFKSMCNNSSIMNGYNNNKKNLNSINNKNNNNNSYGRNNDLQDITHWSFLQNI